MTRILQVAYVQPPLSEHEYRGVGTYTRALFNALKGSAEISVRQVTPQDDMTVADVIHYTYFDPFFLSLPLSHPCPFIVTVHDLIPLVFPREFPTGIRGWLKWQRQKYALGMASLIVTDSYASQADLVQLTKYSLSKIKVIYLGVDPSFSPQTSPEVATAIRRRFHLPERFILYVGDLNYNKNIPGLLMAFQTLAESTDLHLVLVGKGFVTPSEPKEQADKKIRLLHLESRVHQLGYVTQDEIIKLYSQAVCYVQPSFAEGFGLPVLEAMACGCPVVCSHSTSLGEIAAGYSVGIDPQVPLDIARGVFDIINNEGLRKSLSDRGSSTPNDSPGKEPLKKR